jgi:hypothetical protein
MPSSPKPLFGARNLGEGLNVSITGVGERHRAQFVVEMRDGFDLAGALELD